MTSNIKIAVGILLFTNLLSYANQNIIRVKCIITEKYKTYWNSSVFKFLAPELKKGGIHFVDSNYDAILCNRVTDEILQKNKPIIILERKSSANLSKYSANYITDSRVKAVFKNTMLRPEELYNEQTGNFGRYHFGLIERYAKIGIGAHLYKNNFSKDVLRKIYCVPWHCTSSSFCPRFAKAKTHNINFDKNRPIDVFFVGNTNCNLSGQDAQFFCWHRVKACEAVQSMVGIKSLIIDGHPFSHGEYLEKIRQSKVVVSPWGWGEWCYRDCEAMLCGAVLIKPDSSFVKTFPELYHNNSTYIPCKPDFSDLEEKIEHVVSNYHLYKDMRKRAWKIMKEETSIFKLGKHFAYCVRQALKK